MWWQSPPLPKIQATRVYGQRASYWNAFLLNMLFTIVTNTFLIIVSDLLLTVMSCMEFIIVNNISLAILIKKSLQ